VKSINIDVRLIEVKILFFLNFDIFYCFIPFSLYVTLYFVVIAVISIDIFIVFYRMREIISLCLLTFVVDATYAESVIQNPKVGNEYYRLPNHTRPLLYDLRLNPHLVPDNFTFNGEVLVDIEILNRTKTLTLHSKNLTIDEDATRLRMKNASDLYAPVTHEHDDLSESLSLVFDKELAIGRYILHLKFTGALNDEPYGFYKNSYVDEAGDTM